MGEGLLALPHSGLRGPHTGLRVTSARAMPGTDGEMLDTAPRQRRHIVGHLVNEGRGGATFFQPSGARFRWRDLTAYVAACRTPAGDPVPEDLVLDVLVDENRTDRAITAATRRDVTPLRLCAALTARRGYERGDDEWWQIWTSHGWEDLTDRADS